MKNIHQNKVAIVTGAGTGLGAATAKRLGQEGAKVVVNYFLDAQKNDALDVVDTLTEAGSQAIRGTS